MSEARMIAESEPVWFVGAWYADGGDQTSRFIRDGIWEINQPSQAERELVQSMAPGQRIAIKSLSVRKNGLPFDNRGNSVSVMTIKARGVITANPGTGHNITVQWDEGYHDREWLFCTYRKTIWSVNPGVWTTDALIDFTFNDAKQDIDRFRNAPYWQDRFGDGDEPFTQFEWTGFFTEFAEKLLRFADDRGPLVAEIHRNKKEWLAENIVTDQYADGTSGPMQDICPFTTFALICRGLTYENRTRVAGSMGKFLGVETPAPKRFDGMPIMNNQNVWFFSYAKTRKPDDIDNLWAVFKAAMALKTEDTVENRNSFVQAYDTALNVRNVKWNLTFGLYWACSQDFLSLDQWCRSYLDRLDPKHQITLGGKPPSGAEYLEILDKLRLLFTSDDFPVHSFQQLSLAAWRATQNTATDQVENVDGDGDGETGDASMNGEQQSFSIEDIIAEGCFLGKQELEDLLSRLRQKKNVILQGPPGTGKTWLARRLAFALIGAKDQRRVRAVQFHPNLSYEDFVRGWRPTAEGRLAITDGIFMEAVKAAHANPSVPQVVVIEEINRGNPAQIFGEMLTLLDADKRNESEALELSYPDSNGERKVFLPPNLYVIGTMNIADRSLALVDFALRRRFAFADLLPNIDATWHHWVVSRCGLSPSLASAIQRKMKELNNVISADKRLGKQFQVGHSYVTPTFHLGGDGKQWFHQVVKTELQPLLQEYWFDDAEAVTKAVDNLLSEQ
ncbi:MAG: AAA family ATPase [Bradyrhizobiaceae bacterium]|nr:AAA family ATPase [Bradyrhizobiaceae bacterium]